MKQFHFRILAVTWLIFITIMLCLPGSAFPREDWLDRLWVDKWVHIILFTVLLILWTFGFSRQPKDLPMLAVVGFCCLIYAILMEYIQLYFIQNRSFDVGDIIADGVGIIIGIVITQVVYKKNRPL